MQPMGCDAQLAETQTGKRKCPLELSGKVWGRGAILCYHLQPSTRIKWHLLQLLRWNANTQQDWTYVHAYHLNTLSVWTVWNGHNVHTELKDMAKGPYKYLVTYQTYILFFARFRIILTHINWFNCCMCDYWQFDFSGPGRLKST